MAVQKQDDQHEHTFSSYVRIRDVVLKTCLGQWTIVRSGERGSGISVLPAWHDYDDDDCGSENTPPYTFVSLISHFQDCPSDHFEERCYLWSRYVLFKYYFHPRVLDLAYFVTRNIRNMMLNLACLSSCCLLFLMTYRFAPWYHSIANLYILLAFILIDWLPTKEIYYGISYYFSACFHVTLSHWRFGWRIEFRTFFR